MSIPETTIKLSKLEIARRHLDAALELWFQDSDPIPVHTLACAAHDVFSHICKHKNLSPLIFDPAHYRNGMDGEAKKLFHKHYNFFKHADRDPEGTIEFPPSISEFFMYMCIEGWQALGNPARELDHAFVVFLLIRHPELHTTNTPQRLQQLHALLEAGHLFQTNNRAEFLRYFRAANSIKKENTA